MTDIILGHPDEIILGNFAQGELPDPVTYDFFKADGTTPIDISGATAESFDISKNEGAPYAGAGTVTFPAVANNNRIQYDWDAADLQNGFYEAMFWLTKGGITRASVKIRWWVGSGVKV